MTTLFLFPATLHPHTTLQTLPTPTSAPSAAQSSSMVKYSTCSRLFHTSSRPTWPAPGLPMGTVVTPPGTPPHMALAPTVNWLGGTLPGTMHTSYRAGARYWSVNCGWREGGKGGGGRGCRGGVEVAGVKWRGRGGGLEGGRGGRVQQAWAMWGGVGLLE